MRFPILLDFPDQFQTERLLIRAPRPGDGLAIFEAVLESIEALRPWMEWAQQPPQHVEEIEANMRRAAIAFQAREDLRFNLYRLSDGQFVGGSGLHNIHWEVPRFEIGYWVRTSRQGQGYITEAVNGITGFAFRELGAQRMEIRMDSRNQPSIAVAERAGYTLEAALHRFDRTPQGGLRDTLVYVKFPPAG
jgi:RimJ/RimL family protein N-acetyltransferase